MVEIREDLSRTIVVIIFILLLLASSLWVLRPFLAATVWATMIVVSTWPLLNSLQKRLGGHRNLAVVGMTLAIVLVLVVPLWLAIDAIVAHGEDILSLVRKLHASGLPPPPDWVASVPLVGGKLSVFWSGVADAGPQGLLARVEPYAAQAGRWALSQVGGVGFMLIQFMLIVCISAILYAGGESAAACLRRFGQRLIGDRGENAIILAGHAIRGVAMGVGLTAIVQSTLGGIGLAVAGVPFASLLFAIMFMLCIVQVGPSLILFPAVGWVFWTGETGWGIFLLVWSLVVVFLDTFLRPMLIRKSVDLPALLIFAGVFGGVLGFGLIGVFVGPVVLAVTYTLLKAWLDDGLGKTNETEMANGKVRPGGD